MTAMPAGAPKTALKYYTSNAGYSAMNGHLHRLYDGLPEIENEPLDSTYSGSDAEFEWRNRRDDL